MKHKLMRRGAVACDDGGRWRSRLHNQRHTSSSASDCSSRLMTAVGVRLRLGRRGKRRRCVCGRDEATAVAVLMLMLMIVMNRVGRGRLRAGAAATHNFVNVGHGLRQIWVAARRRAAGQRVLAGSRHYRIRMGLAVSAVVWRRRVAPHLAEVPTPTSTTNGVAAVASVKGRECCRGVLRSVRLLLLVGMTKER